MSHKEILKYTETRQSVLFGFNKEILAETGIQFNDLSPVIFDNYYNLDVDDPENIKKHFKPILHLSINEESFFKETNLKLSEAELCIVLDDKVLRNRLLYTKFPLNDFPKKFKVDLNVPNIKISGSQGIDFICSINRKKSTQRTNSGWHKSHNIAKKLFSLNIPYDQELFDIHWLDFEQNNLNNNGFYYIKYISHDVVSNTPKDCFKVFLNKDVRISYLNLERNLNGALFVRSICQQIISDIFYFTFKNSDFDTEPESDSLQAIVKQHVDDLKLYNFNDFVKEFQDDAISDDIENRNYCNLMAQHITKINNAINNFVTR